jgi:hypothetical protein
LKALSLTQPWLQCILHLGKRVENREWKGCNFRGPIYLHASKGIESQATFSETVEAIHEIVSPPPASEALLQLRDALGVFSDFRGHDSFFRPASVMPRGGICGRATIVDVIRPARCPGDAPPAAREWPVAFDAWVERGGEAAQRRWWFGGFALVLADVEPVPFTPCKGALGLWNVPADIERQIARTP